MGLSFISLGLSWFTVLPVISTPHVWHVLVFKKYKIVFANFPVFPFIICPTTVSLLTNATANLTIIVVWLHPCLFFYCCFPNHCGKSVRIRSYSGPYSVRTWENTEQNNSEYEQFSRSECSCSQDSPLHMMWFRISFSSKLGLKCLCYN